MEISKHQHNLIHEYFNHCKNSDWVGREVYKFQFAHYIHDKIDWNKQTDEEVLGILEASQKVKYPDSLGYGIQFIQVSGKLNRGDCINLRDVKVFRQFREKGDFRALANIDLSNLSTSYPGFSAWLSSLFPEKYYPVPLKGYDETNQYFFAGEVDKFNKTGRSYIQGCQPYLQKTEELLRDYNFESFFLDTIQSFFKENENLGITPKTKFTKVDWVWLVQDFHLFLLRKFIKPEHEKQDYVNSEVTILSVNQWEEILNDEIITKKLSFDILRILFDAPENKASSKAIGLSLEVERTKPHATVNFEVARFAKRVAKKYSISFSKRANNDYMYWDLFFLGFYDKDKFIWQLKPNLKKALSQVVGLAESNLLSEEISVGDSKHLYEGAKKTIIVNSYERNWTARQECIEHWGAVCSVCDFDFERRYGDIGKGFIHVHHLKLLSSIGENYKIDPINDLRPVCPNCHAMLHKRNPPLTIEELKGVL